LRSFLQEGDFCLENPLRYISSSSTSNVYG
jgi:hypothetical protein